MPPHFVPDLKFNARDGGYARGQEGYELILRAALDLMIEHGYKALSFRRIAESSGMKVGHISYYFTHQGGAGTGAFRCRDQQLPDRVRQAHA